MNSLDKIREFFKKGIFEEKKVESIDKVLDLSIDTLFGMSPVHAETLRANGIITIKDLAECSETPKIRDLPERVFLKYQKTAIMLLDYATKPTEKKIIILGLDNAGKTSILSILQKKYSIIKNLMPTRGVSRQVLNFLGTSVIAWDFGGQIGYRNLYLSRPDLFLESDLCIFVIDVLDTNRYDESFQYLSNILDTIGSLEETPPIIIDLHKYDPDVQEDTELARKRATLIDKIATKSLEMQFDCTFINTTIYIKETIDELFSLAIQKMSATNFLLEHIVSDYCSAIGAKAIALMTTNNFVVSTYSSESTLESIVTQTGLLLQALLGFYQKSGFKKESTFRLVLEDNKTCIAASRLFPYNEDELFIWAIFDGNETSAKFPELDKFKNEVRPLFQII